ncbi:MAG: hypothetical protein ACPL6C_00060 [bacterium]
MFSFKRLIEEEIVKIRLKKVNSGILSFPQVLKIKGKRTIVLVPKDEEKKRIENLLKMKGLEPLIVEWENFSILSGEYKKISKENRTNRFELAILLKEPSQLASLALPLILKIPIRVGIGIKPQNEFCNIYINTNDITKGLTFFLNYIEVQ